MRVWSTQLSVRWLAAVRRSTSVLNRWMGKTGEKIDRPGLENRSMWIRRPPDSNRKDRHQTFKTTCRTPVLGSTSSRRLARSISVVVGDKLWRRRRQALSLSSWLRDYLYIPLGGNRRGTVRTYINLMLTMLIGGLWHGAAWTFVIWGGLHDLYLVAQRLISPWLPNSERWSPPAAAVYRVVCMTVIFAAVCVTWVFFRAQTFDGAITFLTKIVSLQGVSPGSVQNQILAAKGLILIGVLVTCEALHRSLRLRARSWKSPTFAAAYFSAVLLSLAWLGTFSNSPFIYFQF